MPANWMGKASRRRAKQINGKSNSRDAGEVIAEKKSVAWHGGGNELSEPLEQTLIRCVAKVVWRNGDDAIEPKIECQPREVNAFAQTGSARSGQESEVRMHFADSESCAPQAFALGRRKGRSLARRAKKQGTVTPGGGEKSQERRESVQVRSAIVLERRNGGRVDAGKGGSAHRDTRRIVFTDRESADIEMPRGRGHSSPTDELTSGLLRLVKRLTTCLRKVLLMIQDPQVEIRLRSCQGSPGESCSARITLTMGM